VIKYNFFNLLFLLFLISCSKDDIYFKKSFNILPDNNSVLNIDSYLEDRFLGISDNDLVSDKYLTNKGVIILPSLTLDKKKFRKKTYKYSNISVDAPFFAKPIFNNDVIFLLDANGRIIAYNIKKNNVKWQLDLFNDDKINHLFGGILLDDNRIYVSNGSHYIYAINAENGKLIWNTDLGFNVRSKPYIVGNKLVISRIDNYLISLNKFSGKRLFGKKYEEFLEANYLEPGLISKGNLILNANGKGDLKLLDINKFVELWSDNISNSNIINYYNFSDIISSPIINDNKIFAISNDGYLSSYEFFSGEKLWEQKISTRNNLWHTENLLFLINNANYLAALSPENGSVKWSYNLNKEDKDINFYGPQIINNYVVVISNNGKLFLFDYNNGELLKTFKIPKNINQFPLISDNKIFLVDNSSKFYILD